MAMGNSFFNHSTLLSTRVNYIFQILIACRSHSILLLSQLWALKVKPRPFQLLLKISSSITTFMIDGLSHRPQKHVSYTNTLILITTQIDLHLLWQVCFLVVMSLISQTQQESTDLGGTNLVTGTFTTPPTITIRHQLTLTTPMTDKRWLINKSQYYNRSKPEQGLDHQGIKKLIVLLFM